MLLLWEIHSEWLLTSPLGILVLHRGGGKSGQMGNRVKYLVTGSVTLARETVRNVRNEGLVPDTKL